MNALKVDLIRLLKAWLAILSVMMMISRMKMMTLLGSLREVIKMCGLKTIALVEKLMSPS